MILHPKPQLCRIGIISLDRQAVLPFGFFPQRIGFGKQTSGIKGCQFDRPLRLRNHMGENLILETKARGENQRPLRVAHQQGQPSGNVTGGKV